MGNSHKSSSESYRMVINNNFQNIKQLEEIGIQMKTKQANKVTKEEKKLIIKLYKSFYYPIHPLTKLEEMNECHFKLRSNLKKLIEMYNEYNSTNINVDEYVKNTVENLQPTLRVIGV